MDFPEDLPAALDRALDGHDEPALGCLVGALTPVVQARVARKLLGHRDRSGRLRDVRQEVDDLSQEVFLALFQDDARILRSWQPGRGLSLENFVGLVAERQAVSILRSGRRTPWREDPTLADDLDRAAGGDDGESAEEALISRDTLGRLLDRLAEELSPLGRFLFDLLLVEETPVAEAITATGMSADALYAWRSRLKRTARRLLGDLSEPMIAARRTSEDRHP